MRVPQQATTRAVLDYLTCTMTITLIHHVGRRGYLQIHLHNHDKTSSPSNRRPIGELACHPRARPRATHGRVGGSSG